MIHLYTMINYCAFCEGNVLDTLKSLSFLPNFLSNQFQNSPAACWQPKLMPTLKVSGDI